MPTCETARSCSSPPRQQPAGSGQTPRRHQRRDIAGLNIPTGMPLVYELDDDFIPTKPGEYLDPGMRLAAAAAVAKPGALVSAEDPAQLVSHRATSGW